jgi:hypothetical protein
MVKQLRFVELSLVVAPKHLNIYKEERSSDNCIMISLQNLTEDSHRARDRNI